MCASILSDAQRLVRIGQFDTRLNQFVYHACELLDDMDEVLVSLHPVRDAADFTTAAGLHRVLEQIQAAIPSVNRARPATPKLGRAP